MTREIINSIYIQDVINFEVKPVTDYNFVLRSKTNVSIFSDRIIDSGTIEDWNLELEKYDLMVSKLFLSVNTGDDYCYKYNVLELIPFSKVRPVAKKIIP